MTIEQHRNTEILGGVVNLLTIDASVLTGNIAHVRRYVNHFGEDGTGVLYQGKSYTRYPYEIKVVKRSAQTKRKGSKVNIASGKDSLFLLFLEDIGGTLNGARIYEYRVYERYLDEGVEPNPLAYVKRLDHKVNYTEENKDFGETIIHTIDPLTKDIKVPTLTFSAGIPNDPNSYINVFPAANRSITEGR